MARTGNSTIWLSRNQPSVLRGARSATSRARTEFTETCDVPSRKWLFPRCDSPRPQHRYHDGVYSARRPDDGDQIRLPRSGNSHLLDARRNSESPADQEISLSDSAVSVLIIRAQEDWAIARDCWRLASAKSQSGASAS